MATQKELKRFLDLYDYIQKAEEIILKQSKLTEEQAYQRLEDIAFTNGIYQEMRRYYEFIYQYLRRDTRDKLGYKAIYLAWKDALEKAVIEVKKLINT